MNENILTETGELQDRFLPSIYFDSSIVIDYWLTHRYAKEESYEEYDDLLSQKREYLKKLLKVEGRLSQVTKIKNKMNSGKARATAVISPICLLELAEWYAEARFKQAASEEAGIMYIQRKSKKEIGEYLSKLLNLIEEDLFTRPNEAKGAGELFLETSFPFFFAEVMGLKGLLFADIVNFSLSSRCISDGAPPGTYAFIQVGTTDIMHILLAQHLGCTYIASFDSDFQRARALIKATTGIELLSTPEEILSIL